MVVMKGLCVLGEVHYGWIQKHLQEMMGFQVCSHQIVEVESTTICFELEFLGFSSMCFLSCYWSFRGSPAFIVNRGFRYFHKVEFTRQSKSNHFRLV